MQVENHANCHRLLSKKPTMERVWIDEEEFYNNYMEKHGPQCVIRSRQESQPQGSRHLMLVA